MVPAMNLCMGKPDSASSIAGAATSAKLRVPNLSSAVIHASGAPGTTERRTPAGMLLRLALEELDACLARPGPDAGERHDLTAICHVNDDGGDSRKVDEVRMDDR